MFCGPFFIFILFKKRVKGVDEGVLSVEFKKKKKKIFFLVVGVVYLFLFLSLCVLGLLGVL